MKSLVLLIGTLLFSMPYLMAQDHGHGHDNVKPTHGGEILEVGEHVAHIEYVRDQKRGKVSLYVLDKNGESMGIGDAPRLNLIYTVDQSEKKIQLITKAINLKDGKSHEFEIENPILESENFEGKISIKIMEKSYQVELHHHNHGNHDGHQH